MSAIEDFLSAKEEQEIVVAIREAEQNTSGEIRVHLEETTSKEHFDRAVEVFYNLKMFNTAKRNAVLIYIAVKDHQFVIYGDKGINAIVGNDFWNTTRDFIQKQFQIGNFKQGVVNGVLQIGRELQVHFPWDKEDTNELTNEVSKG